MSRSIAAARWPIVFVAAVGLFGFTPPVTLAHAEIVSSAPAANASLVEAPGTLKITFSEPIDPDSASIGLVDSQGRSLDLPGPIRVSSNGRTAEIALPSLERGVYSVRYQVVSTVDGHATAGSYAFLVDPTGAAPPPTDSSSSTSPSVDAITVAARWLALAAMLVALGSLLLWWHAGSPELRASAAPTGPPWALVGVACGLAAVGIASYLALSARPIADAGGTGIPFDVAAPFGWTPFAIAMRVAFVAALAASILCLLGARRRGGLGWGLGIATVLAVGLAGMSLAGHAAARGGLGFAAIDWLHLVGAAAWLGALPGAIVLSARAATRRRGLLLGILRRHGRVAIVAAPLVALTGIANSPLVLGSSRDLVASDYGNLLVAKAALLSVALGIGAVNHLALRGRGRAWVAGLLAAELVVAAVAVSAAATMVTIQPASARQPVLATTPVNPAHLFGIVGPTRVHASISLPIPGEQAYRVLVTDAETGAPRSDVQKVFLEFTPPVDAALASERVELERDPLDGLYVATGPHTPVEGEWGVAVIVRRAGERDERLPFEVAVTSPATPELGPPPDTGIGVPPPLAATWALLPSGPMGWIPAALALALLLLAGRTPPSRWRSSARGALVVVVVVTVAAAGSRTLVAAANAPAPAELSAQASLVPEPSAEDGEAIYRANCAGCHGIDGRGDGAVTTLPDAGPLGAAVARASDAELSYRIAYGIAGTPMPAFAGLLTPEERGDLIAYLRQRIGDD